MKESHEEPLDLLNRYADTRRRIAQEETRADALLEKLEPRAKDILILLGVIRRGDSPMRMARNVTVTGLKVDVENGKVKILYDDFYGEYTSEESDELDIGSFLQRPEELVVQLIKEGYASLVNRMLTDEEKAGACFVRHIENHLEEGQEIVCKICDKTIHEIYAESSEGGAE